MLPTAHRASRPPGAFGVALTGALVLLAGLLAAAMVNAAPSSAILPLIAAAGVVALYVAIAHPTLMVAGAALAVPLEAFRPGAISPSAAVIGLAAIGVLIRWVCTTPLRLPRHPALIAFFVLVVVNAAGLVFAVSPVDVGRQLVVWMTLLVVVGGFALTATRRDVRFVMLALAVCGGLAGAVAIIDPKPLTGYVFGGGDVTRATGGFGSPNALGALLVLTMPIQVVLALRGHPIVRAVAAGCFVVSLVGMGLSVSRGAFVGLGAALLVLALWPPVRRMAAVLLPVVLVVSLVGSNPASPIAGKVVERLTEVQTAGSSNPRLVVWRKAPQILSDHPIFGVGALHFGYYASVYGIRFPEGVPDHAHNLILNTAIENGLLGLAAFLAMFATALAAMRRVIRTASGEGAALAYALAAALTGFFVSGLVDDALGVTPIGVAFFLALGCVIGLSLDEQRRASAARPTGETTPT
ncbi:hypothetical protein GKE82_01845 [Conexibacter sp. W3-3-2]|uniref:O-antigen ligase family protein n=1 Tax=Conexibacter sp. W3-3-2 TaxID=2675227 RepID=UPI0012B85A31|nr:O-antigen ligase family protein [Conexibacter sp. W3-3-2]MTD43079.1 hypothetical protein [Conexibacter sp. W3-3-2]